MSSTFHSSFAWPFLILLLLGSFLSFNLEPSAKLRGRGCWDQQTFLPKIVFAFASFPSNTSTHSRTITPPPTQTISRSKSSTITPPATPSLTRSKSSTITPPMTPTPTRSTTRTMTPPATSTHSGSKSRTITPPATPSLTRSKSNTITPASTRTKTPSRTRTETPAPTPTLSITPPQTPSRTRSGTRSRTITPPPTPSKTPSSTRTNSKLLSATESITPPPTRTPTATRSPSVSASYTETVPLSTTVTFSGSGGSPTLQHSATLSESISTTLTLTQTDGSQTVSPSSTLTLTVSPSVSQETLSKTLSDSNTFTLSASLSLPVTGTASFSDSFSTTFSLSPTLTDTGTETSSDSITMSYSASETSELTLTKSLSPSETISMSGTLSTTFSLIVTRTSSLTLSSTETASETHSLTSTISATLTDSPSISKTATLSSSQTFSVTESFSGTSTVDSFTPSMSETTTDTVTETPTMSLTSSISGTGDSSTKTSTETTAFSNTIALSPSVSTSATVTYSLTPSATISAGTTTRTQSQTKTLSFTPSVSAIGSLTVSHVPTVSWSAPSFTQTTSMSATTTASATATPSVTLSDGSHSETRTASLSFSNEPTLSTTLSPSATSSVSQLPTASESVTESTTLDVTPTTSKRPELTTTFTGTNSRSPSLSSSVAETKSVSHSLARSISSTITWLPSLSMSIPRSLSFSPSLTSTPSPSATYSVSSTMSVLPTPSNTIAASATMSQSFSKTESSTLALTASLGSESPSPTSEPSLTESSSVSLVPSISETTTHTLSFSVTSPGHGLTFTLSPTYTTTESADPSLTESFSTSESVTKSLTPSASATDTISPILTITASLSGEKSLSGSASPTYSDLATASVGPSQTSGLTISKSASKHSVSLTPTPGTASRSNTVTLSFPSLSFSGKSVSPSPTKSRGTPSVSVPTPSFSSSLSFPTTSKTKSSSSTHSQTVSLLPTLTSSISATKTGASFSRTVSQSHSLSETLTVPVTYSTSLSLSMTRSTTFSPSLSHSATPSESMSLSVSRTFLTKSNSGSPSVTTSLSLSGSETGGSKTGTHSPTSSTSDSQSSTPSSSLTETHSFPSLSASRSLSYSYISYSPSGSDSLSISASPSPSLSPSVFTGSKSGSSTISQSVSMSNTFTDSKLTPSGTMTKKTESKTSSRSLTSSVTLSGGSETKTQSSSVSHASPSLTSSHSAGTASWSGRLTATYAPTRGSLTPTTSLSVTSSLSGSLTFHSFSASRSRTATLSFSLSNSHMSNSKSETSSSSMTFSRGTRTRTLSETTSRSQTPSKGTLSFSSSDETTLTSSLSHSKTASSTTSQEISPTSSLVPTTSLSVSVSEATFSKTSTRSTTKSVSSTASETISPSGGSASSSRTVSRSMSNSFSETPTLSLTDGSPTLSSTNEHSLSASMSPTETDSSSVSINPTETLTLIDTPTDSLSPSASKSVTKTFTNTESMSASETFTRSSTTSLSITGNTRTTSQSVSESATETATDTTSGTVTESTSLSVSRWTGSRTDTLSPSETLTVSVTPPPTATSTLSFSTTMSRTETLSSTYTDTLSWRTFTRTGTHTLTLSDTRTLTHPSESRTLSSTETKTTTQILSATETLTKTQSLTFTSSKTSTLTNDITATESISNTLSISGTITVPKTDTETLTATVTQTTSLSLTISDSVIATKTLTDTYTGSSTRTATISDTLTATQTFSSSLTKQDFSYATCYFALPFPVSKLVEVTRPITIKIWDAPLPQPGDRMVLVPEETGLPTTCPFRVFSSNAVEMQKLGTHFGRGNNWTVTASVPGSYDVCGFLASTNRWYLIPHPTGALEFRPLLIPHTLDPTKDLFVQIDNRFRLTQGVIGATTFDHLLLMPLTDYDKLRTCQRTPYYAQLNSLAIGPTSWTSAGDVKIAQDYVVCYQGYPYRDYQFVQRFIRVIASISNSRISTTPVTGTTSTYYAFSKIEGQVTGLGLSARDYFYLVNGSDCLTSPRVPRPLWKQFPDVSLNPKAVGLTALNFALATSVPFDRISLCLRTNYSSAATKLHELTTLAVGARSVSPSNATFVSGTLADFTFEASGTLDHLVDSAFLCNTSATCCSDMTFPTLGNAKIDLQFVSGTTWRTTVPTDLNSTYQICYRTSTTYIPLQTSLGVVYVEPFFHSGTIRPFVLQLNQSSVVNIIGRRLDSSTPSIYLLNAETSCTFSTALSDGPSDVVTSVSINPGGASWVSLKPKSISRFRVCLIYDQVAAVHSSIIAVHAIPPTTFSPTSFVANVTTLVTFFDPTILSAIPTFNLTNGNDKVIMCSGTAFTASGIVDGVVNETTVLLRFTKIGTKVDKAVCFMDSLGQKILPMVGQVTVLPVMYQAGFYDAATPLLVNSSTARTGENQTFVLKGVGLSSAGDRLSLCSFSDSLQAYISLDYGQTTLISHTTDSFVLTTQEWNVSSSRSGKFKVCHGFSGDAGVMPLPNTVFIVDTVLERFTSLQNKISAVSATPQSFKVVPRVTDTTAVINRIVLVPQADVKCTLQAGIFELEPLTSTSGRLSLTWQILSNTVIDRGNYTMCFTSVSETIWYPFAVQNFVSVFPVVNSMLTMDAGGKGGVHATCTAIAILKGVQIDSNKDSFFYVPSTSNCVLAAGKVTFSTIVSSFSTPNETSFSFAFTENKVGVFTLCALLQGSSAPTVQSFFEVKSNLVLTADNISLACPPTSNAFKYMVKVKPVGGTEWIPVDLATLSSGTQLPADPTFSFAVQLEIVNPDGSIYTTFTTSSGPVHTPRSPADYCKNFPQSLTSPSTASNTRKFAEAMIRLFNYQDQNCAALITAGTVSPTKDATQILASIQGFIKSDPSLVTDQRFILGTLSDIVTSTFLLPTQTEGAIGTLMAATDPSVFVLLNSSAVQTVATAQVEMMNDFVEYLAESTAQDTATSQKTAISVLARLKQLGDLLCKKQSIATQLTSLNVNFSVIPVTVKPAAIRVSADVVLTPQMKPSVGVSGCFSIATISRNFIPQKFLPQNRKKQQTSAPSLPELPPFNVPITMLMSDTSIIGSISLEYTTAAVADHFVGFRYFPDTPLTPYTGTGSWKIQTALQLPNIDFAGRKLTINTTKIESSGEIFLVSGVTSNLAASRVNQPAPPANLKMAKFAIYSLCLAILLFQLVGCTVGHLYDQRCAKKEHLPHSTVPTYPLTFKWLDLHRLGSCFRRGDNIRSGVINPVSTAVRVNVFSAHLLVLSMFTVGLLRSSSYLIQVPRFGHISIGVGIIVAICAMPWSVFVRVLMTRCFKDRVSILSSAVSMIAFPIAWRASNDFILAIAAAVFFGGFVGAVLGYALDRSRWTFLPSVHPSSGWVGFGFFLQIVGIEIPAIVLEIIHPLQTGRIVLAQDDFYAPNPILGLADPFTVLWATFGVALVVDLLVLELVKSFVLAYMPIPALQPYTPPTTTNEPFEEWSEDTRRKSKRRPRPPTFQPPQMKALPDEDIDEEDVESFHDNDEDKISRDSTKNESYKKQFRQKGAVIRKNEIAAAEGAVSDDDDDDDFEEIPVFESWEQAVEIQPAATTLYAGHSNPLTWSNRDSWGGFSGYGGEMEVDPYGLPFDEVSFGNGGSEAPPRSAVDAQVVISQPMSRSATPAAPVFAVALDRETPSPNLLDML